MKLLVTGCNGQVGWELCRQAQQKGYEVVDVDLPEFDITDAEMVSGAIISNGLSLVINAAAYTAVDKSESEVEPAYAVNRNGAENLAKACASCDIPLIHISTDYVFDGSKKEAYRENDPLAPLGVYGESKAAGEEAVRKFCEKHVIVRTAWVYGVHGHNFVKTMLKVGAVNETVRVVNDQWGCPTFAADLAEALLVIGEKVANNKAGEWGTYHYCSVPGTTWHEFAKEIFTIGQFKRSLKVKDVVPITTEQYPTPAKRPANSILDCSLIRKTFRVQVYDWRDRLRVMLDRVFESAMRG